MGRRISAGMGEREGGGVGIDLFLCLWMCDRLPRRGNFEGGGTVGLCIGGK